VGCFLAQLLYPECELNRSVGCLDVLKMNAFAFQKLMDDYLIIQPTALPSCKARGCPTGTQASHMTYRMNIHSAFTSTVSQINPFNNIQT